VAQDPDHIPRYDTYSLTSISIVTQKPGRSNGRRDRANAPADKVVADLHVSGTVVTV
jgi:hypothetical protein